MTVSIAWVRTVEKCEELIFASDSRLSGDGAVMDHCPKIQMLPRSDCVIAFAGYTGRAYALMNHLTIAINAYAPLARRSMDIRVLRSHCLKIFNSLASSIESTYEELREPDVSFIFGGYSWINKKFDIWSIIYDKELGGFKARPALYALTNPGAKKLFWGGEHRAKDTRNTNLGKIDFGGDQGEEARRRFGLLMTERLNNQPSMLELGKLNMEPFEVLRDMLRDSGKEHTIGGSPQLIKVYQYMNATPIAVYWPNKSSGQISLLGRPVLGYENIDPWILDPDTLRTSHPKYSSKETGSMQE